MLPLNTNATRFPAEHVVQHACYQTGRGMEHHPRGSFSTHRGGAAPVDRAYLGTNRFMHIVSRFYEERRLNRFG